jgi:hypothetical protein
MSEAELEGLLRDELVLKPGAAGTGSLHALHLTQCLTAAVSRATAANNANSKEHRA